MAEPPIVIKNPRSDPKGFSLVELLVVIFIIAVTVGILLVSYSGDRDAKELEASSQEFLGVLREAQNYALTGKQLVEGTIPCGYKVEWSGADADYNFVYYYRPESESACQNPLDSNASTVVYDREMKGAVFSGPGSFLFTLPHGVPIPTPRNMAVSVTLVQGGSIRVVCLYPGGRLSDHEGGICPT